MDEQRNKTRKRCSKCDKLRLPTEYYRDRARKDGRRPDCKYCYKATVDRERLQRQEENAKIIAEDRDRKRVEMEAKLASMGLLQN